MPGIGDQSDTVLRPVAGRQPDQLAYVVDDLEPAVQDIGRRLGIRRWLGWRYTTDYLPIRRYRGGPGDFAARSRWSPRSSASAPAATR